MDDIETFRWEHEDRLEQVVPKPRKKLRSKPFLKGPIPWDWIERVAISKNRSTVLVALALWYQAGRQRTHTEIVLCAKQTENLLLGRKGFQRGLEDLAHLGLIRTQVSPGRCVRVEILSVGEDSQP
jgi:hypothetical protein